MGSRLHDFETAENLRARSERLLLAIFLLRSRDQEEKDHDATILQQQQKQKQHSIQKESSESSQLESQIDAAIQKAELVRVCIHLFSLLNFF